MALRGQVDCSRPHSLGLFCFGLIWGHSQHASSYSWFNTREIFQVVLKESYATSGIEPTLATCKASTLPHYATALVPDHRAEEGEVGDSVQST